jgi:hypothetical protein
MNRELSNHLWPSARKQPYDEMSDSSPPGEVSTEDVMTAWALLAMTVESFPGLHELAAGRGCGCGCQSIERTLISPTLRERPPPALTT